MKTYFFETQKAQSPQKDVTKAFLFFHILKVFKKNFCGLCTFCVSKKEKLL